MPISNNGIEDFLVPPAKVAHGPMTAAVAGLGALEVPLERLAVALAAKIVRVGIGAQKLDQGEQLALERKKRKTEVRKEWLSSKVTAVDVDNKPKSSPMPYHSVLQRCAGERPGVVALQTKDSTGGVGGSVLDEMCFIQHNAVEQHAMND